MKIKPQTPTEQEAFYARKNRRHEMWKAFWRKVEALAKQIPFMLAVLAGVAASGVLIAALVGAGFYAFHDKDEIESRLNALEQRNPADQVYFFDQKILRDMQAKVVSNETIWITNITINCHGTTHDQ